MTRSLPAFLVVVLPILSSMMTTPMSIVAQERPSAPSDPSIELNGGFEKIEDGRAPALRLSLTAALDIALTENTELALARAEEQVARGRRLVARGALLPSLKLGAAAGRKDGRIQGSFGNLQDAMYSTYATGAGLVYEANLVSGLHEAIAERKGVEAANLEALDTEQKLLLRVAELYQNLMLATVGVRIAGQVVDGSERFLSIVQAREEAGLGLGSDVALAEAKLATDGRQAIDAARLRDMTSMRLALALRLDAAIPIEPIEERLAPIHLTDPAEEEGAPQPGMRPDVRAAQQRADAAHDQSQAARWEIWSPDLRAEAWRIDIGKDIDDLQGRSERRGLILWDISPEEFGHLRQRRAEADAARLRAQSIMDRARTEILEVRSGLEASRQSIPLAERGVAAAAETLRLNEARFKAGTAIALEVLDAQNVLARSRLALGRTIVAYNTAQVRLLAATGLLSRGSFTALESPQP